MASTTSTAYDAVPYPSYPLPQTHPDRLATIAALFGMEPAPVERCRVLELGCGDGSNLIPMAMALPASEFSGVDLAARPIAEGRATAAALGLQNLTLRRLDVMRLSAAFGEFDFVIAHGLYSWVGPEVRDKLLAICRANLAPHGVAYVSYNAYPGGHLRQMVREMMLFHTRRGRAPRSVDGTGPAGMPGQAAGAGDPGEQISQARDLVKVLAGSRAAPDVYGTFLQAELEWVLEHGDEYLFHDDLAAVNVPVYFTQFVEHAQAHGLQYLCEADFFETQDHRYPSHVRAAVRAFAGDDVHLREQYLDFLKCRRFRQTLLCHRERALNRAPAPERLRRFHCSSAARPVVAGPDAPSAGVVEFRGPRGAAMQTDHAVAIAAIRHLGEIWPQAASFDALLRVARQRAAGEALPRSAGDSAGPGADPDARALGEILLATYAAGLVDLHCYPPRFVVAPSERPLASPLARLEVQRRSVVTSLRHTSVGIDDALGQRLLQLLDGTRDRAALVDELARILRAGPESRATRGVNTPESPLDQALAALPDELEANLAKLGRLALLVA